MTKDIISNIAETTTEANQNAPRLHLYTERTMEAHGITSSLPETCGCGVSFVGHDLRRINYCAMHEAAPELLKALEIAMHTMINILRGDDPANISTDQLPERYVNAAQNVVDIARKRIKEATN